MSDLLVDFPQTRRHVHFSATSLLTVTDPVAEEDRATMWYSKQEREHHKREIKHDVRRLAQMLSNKPISLIDQEELYDCVGMEVSIDSLCHLAFYIAFQYFVLTPLTRGLLDVDRLFYREMCFCQQRGTS